jgi:dethiobiotin synthetase
MSRVIVVTGTDTGVGKTIVTAALAAATTGSVIVVKPVQTGVDAGEESDADVVHRLTGRAVQELTALDEPLAPESAARRAGIAIPPVSEYADRIRVLAEFHGLVVVEGAGGVLVRLDLAGGTIADLAALTEAEVIVVTRAGLGTLNHTELTVNALRGRGIDRIGLIIGSWPDRPDETALSNLADLPRLTGAPVVARIPEGAGALGREEFVAAAPSWFG